MKATFTAVTVLAAQLSAATSVDSPQVVDAEGCNEAVLARLERLEKAFAEQQVHYENRLQLQERAFHEKLVELQTGTRSSSEPELQRSSRRRTSDTQTRALGATSEAYSGFAVKHANAGIMMGVDGDVGLLRSNDGELTLAAAGVTVTGEMWINGLESSVLSTLQNTTDHLLQVEQLAKRETLAKASMWWPVGLTTGYASYTVSTPFGSSDSSVPFDFPYTAPLGSARMVAGAFTAPEDGMYYITSEIRVADADTTWTEVEFYRNGAKWDRFEMWTPVGDAAGRRTTVSAYLGKLNAGDVIYPLSDIAPSSMKAQTDVFQVGSDRIAFSARGVGSISVASLPIIGQMASQSVDYFQPPELASSYNGGVFTAPRAGLYYCMLKWRIIDKTAGELEIEWQKNGADTDGGFEMWLHSGDSYPRRAHMSALLEELDEGDTLHAQSDSVVTASGTAIMSCFELGDNLPAFKVVNTEAFEYTNTAVDFGDGAATSLLIERGSVGAYASGVYTVPEAGFYYVTVKLRVADLVTDSIGIEIKVNGEDAVGHNMNMYLHQGDDAGQRTGMSTSMLRLEAGDELSGRSTVAMAAGSDVAQWTFSAFKLA